MGRLTLGADCACRHVGLGVSLHGGPPKIPLKQRQSTVGIRVTGETGGVDPL